MRPFRICNIITQYTFVSADIRIRVHQYVKSRNQTHITVFIAADQGKGMLLHGYECANWIFSCICADVDVRMRMYECDRVPAYTAFRMRIFFLSYANAMHRVGRSGDDLYVRMFGFSSGYADAYAHLHP